MVLWLVLVLLFLAFRVVLFWIFRGEQSQRPSGQAFLRCCESGLRSDTCAATWGLLPSFALTLIGFIHPLGIWHQRIRQLTIVIILIFCGIIFVADVGYFAEYDSQFDHWIVGLVYDDRSAILTTIWKSYPIVRLILLGSAAVAISAWALNKLCRVAAAADVPRFLGRKSLRAITFVVIASYDAWALQPEYAGLHLTDGVSALGREGLRAQGFISSGISTIESLGVLITGLPFARVFVNFQPVVREGLPTASARIFKRIGYRRRFFYGGFLSWQRIGQFCREQGFEDVYGGDQMRTHTHGNEWGVEDEDLFRFVLEHTGPEPTFNLIMSTSYHPPYSVDVEKKGFDPPVVKANSNGARLSDRKLRVLGHLWYSDKCVAEFVSEGERELERPLFAITVDHYSRKQYVSARPTHTLFESLAVPLIICGRKAVEKVQRPAALAG